MSWQQLHYLSFSRFIICFNKGMETQHNVRRWNSEKLSSSTKPGLTLTVGFVILMMSAPLHRSFAADENAATTTSAPAQEVVAPAGKKSVTFDINEYRVRGNSLLDKIQIELVLYPFLGKGKTIHDIEDARQALESRYREAGYPTVLVNIPEQSVDNGLVYLYVTEAKIDSLQVTGSNYFSLQRIRQEMPSLKQGHVLYLPAFQEQLALANSRTPDRMLTPVLKRGRLPGTVNIELKVSDKSPLHGSVDVNNQHSASTSKLRANATIRYDNLWQKEHSFTLQYQTAPQKPQEVKVVSGIYLARPTGSRNIYVFSAIHSNSDVATVANSTVVGNGNILGVSSIMPLAADARSSHSVKLDVSYKDLKEETLTGTSSNSQPIKYYSLAGQYSGSLRAESSTIAFNAGFTMGIQALNEKQIDNCSGYALEQFECRRHGATPNFFHLNVGVDYSKSLPDAFVLNARLNGQIADTPMISNEQIGAGGATSVRGYNESERFGDNGLVGSLELQSPSITPLLPEKARDTLNDFHYLLFFDRAWLRTLFPLGGSEDRWQLYSAGAGLRLQAWHNLYAELDWAHAYRDSQSPLETSAPDVRAGENRVHFKVQYAF